jgi:cation diffusion facilitator family transporter
MLSRDIMTQTLRQLLRRDTPQYASFVSLVACIVLALTTIGIGVLEDSLIVTTNGYLALIDIGTSLLFLAAVQQSMRRPDLTFNYGYGKYESLAILLSANLLFALSIYTLSQAVHLVIQPEAHQASIFPIAWSTISLFIMRWTGRLLRRYANRFHMPMLKYDAELWRTDSWMELGVLSSLILSAGLQLAGYIALGATLDALVSVALIVVALKVPLKHGREAFRQLLDRTLPDEMQYEILGVIAENHDRMCEFKSVHTRQSGKDIFIEIDLVMPYDYRLEELYTLESKILDKLHGSFPTAIPRVYVTPCDRSCDHSTGTTCPVKRAALQA